MENSPFDVVNTQTGEITTNESNNSMHNLLGALDNFIEAIDKGESAPKYNASGVYWKPIKAGEKMSAIFTGFIIIQKNEDGTKKPLPAATWIAKDADGIYTTFMHSGVASVSACRNLQPQQPFTIRYDGKEGKTQKFTVIAH